MKLLIFKVDFPYKKKGSAWDLGKFHQGKSTNLSLWAATNTANLYGKNLTKKYFNVLILFDLSF